MRIPFCLLAVLAWTAPAVAAAPAGDAGRDIAPDAPAPVILLAEAQTEVRAEGPETADEAALREDLERAQRQLEEAAQEVARLSVELSGGAMERVVRYFEETGRRAMLGITINDAPDKAGAAAPGVRIVGVSPGGPADEAGLRAGDIIVAMDGRPMRGDEASPADRTLLDFMKTVEPGDAVRVEYSRGGQLAETSVVTRAFEPEAFRFSFGDEHRPMFDFSGDPDVKQYVFRMDDDHHGKSHGGRHLHLVPMTPGLGAYFGTEEGLLVVRAGDDTPLQDGDVILSIDGESVDDARQVLAKMRSLREGESVSLEVVRQRETLSVPLAGRADGWADRRVTRRIEKRRIDPDTGDVEVTVEEKND